MEEALVDPGSLKRRLEDVSNEEEDENEIKKLKQNEEKASDVLASGVSESNEIAPTDGKEFEKSKELIENEEQIGSPEKVDSGIDYRKKKKCVLLLSYCGSGYSGMQRNPGVATIEEDLTNALLKANAITEDASRNYGKMSFQRCARTDKGVSAARQVVSLKMVPSTKLVPQINKYLKPQIRIFALKKVTRGFDCKSRCSSRTYEYLIPTLAFSQSYAHTAPNFRITNDLLERINDVLSLYIGTHNFHNFTSGKAFKEESAKRYMISVRYVDEPFVEQGTEFLALQIKGQSFMQHQIRKMIGLLVAIMRNCTDKDAITRAFQEPKMDIPKVPGLGLILNQVDFAGYNKRFGKDKIHEPLEWDDQEEEIKQFKKVFIYKNIIETEVKTKSMMRWLPSLSSHSYSNAGMMELQPKNEEINGMEEVNENDKSEVKVEENKKCGESKTNVNEKVELEANVEDDKNENSEENE